MRIRIKCCAYPKTQKVSHEIAKTEWLFTTKITVFPLYLSSRIDILHRPIKFIKTRRVTNCRVYVCYALKKRTHFPDTIPPKIAVIANGYTVHTTQVPRLITLHTQKKKEKNKNHFPTNKLHSRSRWVCELRLPVKITSTKVQIYLIFYIFF